MSVPQRLLFGIGLAYIAACITSAADIPALALAIETTGRVASAHHCVEEADQRRGWNPNPSPSLWRAILGGSQKIAQQAAFPAQQKFWRGPSLRFLGAGIRYAKFGWLDIQVYEAALYVEAAATAAELRRLQAAGFFVGGDYGTDRMCEALAAGAATRVLHLRLLRSVTGAQFSDALSKSLEPRIQGTGDEELLPSFVSYFEERSLDTGASIPIMWSEEGALELDLLAPGDGNYSGIKPECDIPSQTFAAALFDIYLAKDGPLVGAREQWALAARDLMREPGDSA